MSAALSGHLVDSFYSNPSARLPGSFVQPMAGTPHIVTSQAMSFAPSMHGGVQPIPPCLDLQPTSIPQHTAMEIATLQAKLNQKLGPEYISQRPGPAGGPKLTYAEGWKIINIANEVFGFNGWSSSVVSLTVDFIDFNDESKRYTVGVTAIVRVTLRYGVFHEDIGYGMLENSKSKGAALDKCKKEAVTDGLKRTLRNFGNVLGNCLYDKSYTQEIVKIKVPPAKFDPSKLHRRPEFEQPQSVTPAGSAPNHNATASTSSSSTSRPPAQTTPLPERPATTVSTLNNDEQKPPPVMIPKRTPVPNTGLNTPMTTPVQRPNLSRPQPRPPIAPADRRVTFEEPNPPVDAADGGSETIYEHDSIVFDSDDEAFLAMVELGEGNLGVPIAHEADLGRPIDFEEGACGLDDAVGGGGRSSDVGARQADDGQQPQRAQQSHERWTGNTVNSRPQSYPPRQASHTSAPDQRPGPRQDQQRPEQSNLPPTRPMAGPQATSSSSSTAPVPNRHQQQRQQSLASSSGSKQTYAEQPAAAPKPGSTLPSALKPTRPTAPSLGGFHFPPGINPLATRDVGSNPPPGGQQTAHRQGPVFSGATAGTKRPADSLPRPPQGMGLAQQQQGMVKREPLGQLEMGAGGAVKRVKR